MSRLTKIYTKTGDRGRTGLVKGKRLSKDSTRIWAYGTVDELNSAIGLARALNAEKKSRTSKKVETILATVQNELFHMGAELATLSKDYIKGMPQITLKHIKSLEQVIDALNSELGPLREFILPGGNKVAASLHMARTICRRAERYSVRLARREKIGKNVIPYLNRLSDMLFVLARWINLKQKVPETLWQKTTS